MERVRGFTENELAIIEEYNSMLILCETKVKCFCIKTKNEKIETNAQFAQSISPMNNSTCTIESRVGDEEGMINICILIWLLTNRRS
jgi:flagellar motor switch protein FliM